VTIVTAQQMTSTVNPNVPVPNTPVEQSGPLFRSNFQAVINDINELFRRTGSSPRIRLAAQLDLYSNFAAGNDGNDCLTIATPCKTAQHAFDKVVLGYDTAGWNVNIHLASNDSTCLVVNTGWVGGGQIAILGPVPTGQPTVGFVGCVGNGVAVDTALPANLNLINLVVSSSGAGAASVLNIGTGNLVLANVAFGAFGSDHISVLGTGARISCLQPTTLTFTAGGVGSPAAGVVASADSGGSFVCLSSTFVFPTSQNYGALMGSFNVATMLLTSSKYCSDYAGTKCAINDLNGVNGGAPTIRGFKFYISTNAALATNTGNVNVLPGDTAGIIASGGQYN